MDEKTLKHAEALLKDTVNYPFVSDVIAQLESGARRSTGIFYLIESSSSGKSAPKAFSRSQIL